MADKKQFEATKIDALYSWLSYDLQKIKGEILNEMRFSSAQTSALYKELKGDGEKSSQAIAQEIRYSYKQNQTIYDGLATLLSEQVSKDLNSLNEKATSLMDVENTVLEMLPHLEETLGEVKYGFMQQQAVYEGLTALISGAIANKIDDIETKLVALEQIDKALEEINLRIAEGIAAFEDADYKSLVESVAEKTEESVSEHSRQILEAVNAIPTVENVDYNRIVDEVGDKMLEILGDVVAQEPVSATPVEATIDYDKLIYGTAEKVVESLPYPEKVDYRRIDEQFMAAAEKVQASVSEEAIAKAVELAVEKAMAAINIDAIATSVAEKIVASQASAIDYERLADMVAQKITANNEPTYELVVDDEGVQTLADGVAQRICNMCETCAIATEEETATEEVVEEPVEETVEEAIVEEIVEETVTEEVVEEPVAQEEPKAEEELAVSLAGEYQEIDNQLVDAETGLVIRLKKSFTAKMKQSEENVKGYYSAIKNELTSYKKVNSNVSWHGDRFNYGRDTVAKINISGKTLCFYLDLDPEDPNLKQTVYHQKNVGNQKAYERTPFMMKVRSDAAMKKALRLVGYLAEKYGTVKNEKFEAVDYVSQFAYASTKQLFDDGFIKVTKEKKVEFDF